MIRKEEKMVLVAKTWYSLGHIEEAKGLLLSLSESEPDNWEIWYWLAMCELNREKIILYLKKMVEADLMTKRLVEEVWREKSTQKLTSSRNEYDEVENEMYEEGLRAYRDLSDPFDEGTDIFED